MTPATDNRKPTTAIINALMTAASAAMLADGLTPAFGRVEFFDCEKITEAFQYLLITEQRVCVVVPLEEKFETIVRQPKLLIKRKIPVMLMISDRIIGSTKRKAALIGDLSTPGAYGLADLVLPAVTGVILENPNGVLSVPVASSILTISDNDQKKIGGRVCVCIELECTGGTMEANVGPGPIL